MGQRTDRCLRQDSEVRWYPGPVQRLHHLRCRYLHLPWHVLRSLRHPEANPDRRKDSSVAASFILGWAVTVTAGLMSYPIDTIRRRMMMTSGGGVKYKGSIDCAVQIMKNEGFMSLMKGAGA